MKHAFAAAVGIAAVVGHSQANAVPLDPNGFASLGTVFGGALVIDTDTLTVTGGPGGSGVAFSQGGVPYAQQGGEPPDIAVFTFDGGSTLGNVTITGSRAAAILFQGSATVTGTIDISGAVPIAASGGNPSAVGGADGGNGGPSSGHEHGFGPGGGEKGSTSASGSGAGGGAGGGFGTQGGNSGAGVTLVSGGIAHGDLLSALQGGSGGGGGGGFLGGTFGGGGGGGAGGGAIEIGALHNLDLAGATILADGGDGSVRATLSFTGGGGGSGGGILLHGFNVSLDSATLLSANGGDGGVVGSNTGGCGGAGQIAIVSNDDGALTNLGTVQAISGTGGAGCRSAASVPASLPRPIRRSARTRRLHRFRRRDRSRFSCWESRRWQQGGGYSELWRCQSNRPSSPHGDSSIRGNDEVE